jgi:phosphatidylserine/phosphatidylglycerophosphate/cardiolipin synthase-like enzyme
MFDPQPRVLGLRLHVFRRMHRKIVIVDGRTRSSAASIFRPTTWKTSAPRRSRTTACVSKVRSCRASVLRARAARARCGRARPQRGSTKQAGDAEVMFVARDNRHQRDAIERQYRAAIHAARHEVVIANAYFFPGYRLLRAMRRAVRRGVRVRLILQGQPDMKIVKHAARLLHPQLIAAGVEIYEYCKRPMHAKIALVDEAWSTVGSSNLDPLSLSLNFEANVMIRDRGVQRRPACAARAADARRVQAARLRRDQAAPRRLARAAGHVCLSRDATLPRVGRLPAGARRATRARGPGRVRPALAKRRGGRVDGRALYPKWQRLARGSGSGRRPALRSSRCSAG